MNKKKVFTRMAAAAMACCMLGSTAFSGYGMEKVCAEEPENAEWDAIQSVVSRYYGEWHDTSYPGLVSDTIPKTALLGNGDVGVTSGGNDVSKTFYISKGDFWTYSGAPLPIGGVTIGEQPADTGETGVNIAPTYKNVTAISYLSIV